MTPVALFAFWYLIHTGLRRFQLRRQRRARTELLRALRNRIRRERPGESDLRELLYRRLPGDRIAILRVIENHFERVNMESPLNTLKTNPDDAQYPGRKRDGGMDITAALEELEASVPMLVREMRRNGIHFARLENADARIGAEGVGEKKSSQISAYVLRIRGPLSGQDEKREESHSQEPAVYALGVLRDARALPDADQLSRFVAFLTRYFERDDGDKEELREASPDWNDSDQDEVRRVRDENRRLRRDIAARDNSLARIMHDIRLPLAGLLLNHEMLEKRAADDDARRPLRLMKNQLNTLESFTHDILQLETGQWQDQGPENASASTPGEMDPNRVVSELLETFQESLNRKSIAVRFEAGPVGHCRVRGAAMERILYNLISNSIKFCSSPGQLDIISRRRDGFLTIEIEDSGPGLPTSEDTLFELARRNIGRGGRGWGLGLASAMDLAEKLGGKLVVIPPKIASGANFLLVLPV